MNKIKYVFAFLVLFSLCGCKKEEEIPLIEDPTGNLNVNGNTIQQKYLTGLNIINEKDSTLSMPPFVLTFSGIVNKTINSNSIGSIKLKDIITYRTKDYYTSSADYIEVRNTGIRLVDVLSYVGVTEYSEITFIDQDNGEIKLPAAKIDKEVYLVFYENGNSIGEGKVNLVIPAYVDIFWAQGIKEIKISR